MFFTFERGDCLDSNSENLAKFMSRLTAAYLKYFNHKYIRSGNLFEGRYQAVLAEDDLYLPKTPGGLGYDII